MNDTNLKHSARFRTGTMMIVAIATLAFLGAGLSAWAQGGTPMTFYVATNGNDSWNGKSPTNIGLNIGPFASLARAQLAAQGFAKTNPVTIQIEGGAYYLPLSPTSPGTLVMGTADSGNASNPIVWQNYNGQTPIVSGGVPVGAGGLGLTWHQVSAGSNVWSVTLPSTLQPFEYLFYTPISVIGPGASASRRLRARLESSIGVGYYMSGGQCHSTNPPGIVNLALCNLGTFVRVLTEIAPDDPNDGGCKNFSTASDMVTKKCLDRFSYNPSDPIVNWINLTGVYSGLPGGEGFAGPCRLPPAPTYPTGDIELTLTDAWTVDVMRIACLDTAHHVVFLTAATNSGGGGANYNFFGPLQNHRYMIENAKDAFLAAQAARQTGLWFLDRSTTQPVLTYIANTGENPNVDIVVIPQLPLTGASFPVGGQFPLLDSGGNPLENYIGGSLVWATGLSFVTFRGITFEVDNFYPNSSTGFNNDVNGEMSVPQAIDCQSCQNVTFDNTTFRHTSASAILIASPGSTGPPAQNDTIQNSTFFDIGDSGVRIGHRPNGNDLPGDVVSNVTVQNNLINGYSRVFADGEGIAQGNGNTITYSHNDILDGYHAGISICQLDCPANVSGANGTNIVTQFNHLRNMMQGITSDGGSLYYNVGGPVSSGVGNQILNNLVHDTTDSSIIDTINGTRVKGSAYGGEGLYLDAQSANVMAMNNVVYHMSGHAIHLTKGIASNQNPDRFQNNIFSLAIEGMFTQGNPWPSGCPAALTPPLVQLWWNIFNFDLNEDPTMPSKSFFVQEGCTNSCGRAYYQFQDFEANAYWRAGTPGTGPLFCSDPSAFHVVKNPASNGSCLSSDPLVFLTFNSPPGGAVTWQHGRPPDPPGPPVIMNEDGGQDGTTQLGTCSWNPNFGVTGNPSDYLLTGGPPTPFDITQTNNTIKTAGRTSGAAPVAVPATFPTYAFTSF